MVVVIPWPKDAVASLHFPHLDSIGFPTSSISNSILFKTPMFSKKNLNLSMPTFCPILTEPIFPDLIKISSAVKSLGIFESYSPIGFPAHQIFFSKSKNWVWDSISPSFRPAANVKVLKTEPSS